MDKIKPSNYSFSGYDNPYYEIILHTNGYAALLFGLLGMFLTLFKSPKAFGAYKYFLFNICFWAFSFDFYMTILYTPTLLFPALVMCPGGLFKTTNNTIGYITFSFFLIFFGSSTIAILSAFIYRYAALKNKVNVVLSWPFLIFLGILHFTYELPTIVLYGLGATNRTAIDEAILKQWPNIADHYIGKGCAAVHYSVTPWPTYFMFICVIDFAAGVPIVTLLIVKSFKSLRAQQSIMSAKTYRMHRQLLISLIFQLIVPLVSLFGPFIVISICVLMELALPGFFSQLTFILGTMHSPMNCIMMLGFIPHYRNVLLQYACCFRTRFRNIWNTSSQQQNTQHTNHSTHDTRTGNKVNPTQNTTAGDVRASLRETELL